PPAPPGPEPGAAFPQEPGLVLHLVVLETQGFTGTDEEQLADVPLGLGPDELPPPRLFDAPGREAVPAASVLRHEERSASCGIDCPAPIRRPWASSFPPPSMAPGPTTARFRTWQPEPSSAASSATGPVTA